MQKSIDMAVTAVTIGILLIFTGCSQKPAEQILGKWKDQDSGIVTEFFEDGTMTMKHPTDRSMGSDTFTGSWLILNDGRLKLSFTVIGTPRTATGTLIFPQKDFMVIAYEDGSSKSTSMRMK